MQVEFRLLPDDTIDRRTQFLAHLDQMLGLMTNDDRLLRVAFDINRNQNMGFAVALGVIGVGVLDAVHDDRERMGQFVVKLLKESPTHKFGDS